MEGVIREAERLLANILTSKLALRQNKLSPFEMGPVVRLTKAQMLIRRGSAWDIAVEEMMRGDDEGESWAKAALQVALGALSLFPGAWVVALVSAGLDLYSAGTAYVRYGLDTALIGTSMDRAKALSDKTPSLAPFAFALLGAGLNAVGARAAFAEAEALSAKAMAGEAQAIADLNKLGETHHVAHLGDDVAKARPAGSQSRTGYSRTAPTSEEEIASAAGRTRRPVGATNRGRSANPRFANDPVKPKVPGAPKTKVAFEPDFAKLDLATLDQEKLRQLGPPTPERPWHGRLEGVPEGDPRLKGTIGGKDITDIDAVENGVLLERKTAVDATDPKAWAEKQITEKYENLRLLRAQKAREYPEYEYALIGFRFEGGTPAEEFWNAVYDAKEALERKYGTHIPVDTAG